jgi:hypothetical protein
MGFFTRRAPTFSNAASKSQFMSEWATGVLVEAGCRQDHEQAQQLAQTAADGVLRQALVSVSSDLGERQITSYLQGLDPDVLLYLVDEMYSRTIEMATAGRPGPALRARISRFDSTIDQTFAELRPNYVNYAQVNFG